MDLTKQYKQYQKNKKKVENRSDVEQKIGGLVDTLNKKISSDIAHKLRRNEDILDTLNEVIGKLDTFSDPITEIKQSEINDFYEYINKNVSEIREIAIDIENRNTKAVDKLVELKQKSLNEHFDTFSVKLEKATKEISDKFKELDKESSKKEKTNKEYIKDNEKNHKALQKNIKKIRNEIKEFNKFITEVKQKDTTPEEIRDKLQSLKNDERLDASAIKNLAKFVAAFATGSAGVADFLGLTDTPASYSGEAGKLARVNATETGLEFTTVGILDVELIKSDVTKTSHGFSLLQVVYHDGADWQLARADADTTLATHVVIEIIDANNFTVCQAGRVVITSHGLTVGEYYYTDDVTAGAITTVEPSAYSNVMLFVEDANTIIVLDYRPMATGGAGAATFLGLTDTPASYSGQGGKTVKVNSGETALEFTSALFPGIITVSAGGGADYTTIIAAAAAAVSGDTILVYPGVYDGKFTIPNGVDLAGVDANSVTITYDASNPLDNGPLWIFSGGNNLSKVKFTNIKTGTEELIRVDGGSLTVDGILLDWNAGAMDTATHYAIRNLTTGGNLKIYNSSFIFNGTASATSEIIRVISHEHLTAQCWVINSSISTTTVTSGTSIGIYLSTAVGRDFNGTTIQAVAPNGLGYALWQNAGTITDEEGVITIGRVFPEGGFNRNNNLGSGSFLAQSVGNYALRSFGLTEVRCDTSAQNAFRLTAAAGQTALMMRVLNSIGSNLFTIDENGAFIANEQGADADCRIEGDTDTDLFFTDASTNRIGIGTVSPNSKLMIDGNANEVQLRVQGNATQTQSLQIWETNAAVRAGFIDPDGRVGLGTSMPASPSLSLYRMFIAGSAANPAPGTYGLRARLVVTDGSIYGFDGSSSDVACFLFRGADASGSKSRIVFMGNSSVSNSSIYNVVQVNGQSGNLAIDTAPSAATGLQERAYFGFNGGLVLNRTGLAATTQKVLEVKASAAHTANLQEWQDSAGTAGTLIDSAQDLVVKNYTDGTRPTAGTAGRIIFNTTDGNLNIDDGTNWILPNGTVT